LEKADFPINPNEVLQGCLDRHAVRVEFLYVWPMEEFPYDFAGVSQADNP
jgi:hypothetical protein